MMIKNTTTHYGLITIFLHWLMAVFLAGLFSIGLYMTSLDYYNPLYHSLPQWHKSFGILTFLLLLMRFIWKLRNIKPDSINTHKKYEVLLAHVIQNIFYILILLIVVTGFLVSTAKGKGIEVFSILEVPAITQSMDESIAELIGEAHFIMAIFLVVFVIMHVLAALKHHYIDKDNTLKRMIKLNIEHDK